MQVVVNDLQDISNQDVRLTVDDSDCITIRQIKYIDGNKQDIELILDYATFNNIVRAVGHAYSLIEGE